jgi:Domain of unknown function (DUF4190)
MTEQPDKPATPPPPPYPYTPGPAYPPPPPPYAGYSAPPPGPRNGLGIAALVIAVIALVTCASVVLGFILGIVAVVIGFAARGRVKRGEANNGGIAIAGIVLGFVAIVASLVFISIWIAVFKDIGGKDYIDCLNKAGNDSARIQQCADQFREHLQTKYSVTLTP